MFILTKLVKQCMAVWLLVCCFSFQSEKINEQTAKALFVYNFTKYFEWTAEKNNGKFVIGIYGHSDILSELLNFSYQKTVNNKEIVVSLINTPAEVTKCSMLYVPHDYAMEIKKLSAITKNHKVLIVSETPGLCSKGSAINIIKKNNRFVFELNEGVIQQAGLKVSGQLLALAIIVK